MKKLRMHDGLAFVITFAALAIGVFALLDAIVAGEGNEVPSPTGGAALTSSTPSPVAPSGGDLSLSKRGVDSVAATVLHGYLTGGPEKASFIIRDVQNRTGCVVLHGRLGDIRGVRDGFEADTRELERRYGAMVGSATEDGAGINLVFDCP